MHEAEDALNRAKDELQVLIAAKDLIPQVDNQMEENKDGSENKEGEGEALMEQIKS